MDFWLPLLEFLTKNTIHNLLTSLVADELKQTKKKLWFLIRNSTGISVGSILLPRT